MKITLIASREVEFEARDGKNKGSSITGYSNAGYAENGELIEFWSTKSHGGEVVVANGYVPAYAEDFDLEAKVFGGKVKWREKE